MIGDDRQQGLPPRRLLYRKLELQRVGIIRASNRYGRFGVREISDASRRLGHPDRRRDGVPGGAGRTSRSSFSGSRRRTSTRSIHWGDAPEGARILNQMRAMGMTQPFFACDRCVSEEFAEDRRGRTRRASICRLPVEPDARRTRSSNDSAKAFRKRFGVEAETYAAHAYDGMNMLIWAIQDAGLNRAKIRDVIAYLPDPWPGVTGDIVLSACPRRRGRDLPGQARERARGGTTRARISGSRGASSRRGTV